MKRLYLFLSLASLLAAPAPAATFGVEDSDFTLWIRVDSTPSFVKLYAVPPKGQEPSVLLGTTPCSIAVDFFWRLHWFKKGWQKITVWSPANAVRAELREDNSYDILLRAVAVMDGYRRENLDLTVATLADPGPKWEGKTYWPLEAKTRFQLTPLARTRTVPAEPPPQMKRVILGDAGAAGTGTLTITSDVPGAEVFVDGDLVGATPIQAVLGSGDHVVQVQREGRSRSGRKSPSSRSGTPPSALCSEPDRVPSSKLSCGQAVAMTFSGLSPEKETALARRMAELGLRETDLEERFIKGSGKGGQKINKTSSCVYLRHRPSGIEIKCQRERSQALNRFLARRELCDRWEQRLRGALSARQQEIEKIRRQKRRRSRRQRARMLADKRHQSGKKALRGPVGNGE